MSVEKGRRFENYIKDKLEARGYYVIRSAGSKGIFDLIAVKGGVPYGIQCKKNGIPKKLREELIRVGEKYGIVPCAAYKNKNNKVVIVNLLNGSPIT